MALGTCDTERYRYFGAYYYCDKQFFSSVQTALDDYKGTK